MVVGHQNKRKIGFIVVSYNSSEYISNCITSINDYISDLTDYTKEVLVIDNNSFDGSQKILQALETDYQFLDVTYLNENIGFGPANNIGFTKVDVDFYVLVNADAWFLTNSLSPVLKIMRENEDIAICGLPLVYPDGSPQTSSYSFSSWHRWLLSILGARLLLKKFIHLTFISKLFQLFPYTREFTRVHSTSNIELSNINQELFSNKYNYVDWVCGAGMIISKKFILECGGFDKNIFLYGEDEDLCIKAHNNKYQVITADIPPIAHVLGWKKEGFNQRVSDLKYKSLLYFINKNIKSNFSRFLMKLILPIYIYGIHRFFFAFTIKSRGVTVKKKTGL